MSDPVITPGEWRIIEGWLPDYRPICHRRSVGRGAIPGLVLIGLGLALFIATWAHRRSNRD